MNINSDCEHYKLNEIQRKVKGGRTFDDPTTVVLHECYHPKNTIAGRLVATSKGCSTKNDFCPLNPNLDQNK
jgi:hypothetical protein